MRAAPNLEAAYSAMAFRQLLHGPQYRVATQEATPGGLRFVPSSDGPTVEEAIAALEQGIAVVYGAVTQGDTEDLETYRSFFGYLLRSFRVAVVTTNYDLVIESALNSLDCRTCYAADRESLSDETVPILKLHGSVNWPSDSTFDLATVATTTGPKEAACVLPPSWNKNLRHAGPFASVWNGAAALLGSARVILVVGHSFPPTDLHLDYLFAEGLSKQDTSSLGKRVVVVDTSLPTAASVCERFLRYQTVGSAFPYAVRFGELLGELRKGTVAL